MMAWIESHTELAQHPKTLRLARRLGISIPTAIGHLHLLWWWALTYAQDGNLAGFSDDELAVAVLWEGPPGDLRHALVAVGFIDEDGRLHDWHPHLIDRGERHPIRRAFEAMRRTLAPLIFARDGHRCVACGSMDQLEIDHIVAIARGGTNDFANLQTLCKPCNRSKGAW